MRHMLILVLRITHRLHPRGLELSMFALRIWRCIDCLHLHIHIHVETPYKTSDVNVLHFHRLPAEKDLHRIWVGWVSKGPPACSLELATPAGRAEIVVAGVECTFSATCIFIILTCISVDVTMNCSSLGIFCTWHLPKHAKSTVALLNIVPLRTIICGVISQELSAISRYFSRRILRDPANTERQRIGYPCPINHASVCSVTLLTDEPRIGNRSWVSHYVRQQL
jgi:hypothetical protein